MTQAFSYLSLSLSLSLSLLILNFLAKLSCLLLKDDDIRYHS